MISWYISTIHENYTSSISDDTDIIFQLFVSQHWHTPWKSRTSCNVDVHDLHRILEFFPTCYDFSWVLHTSIRYFITFHSLSSNKRSFKLIVWKNTTSSLFIFKILKSTSFVQSNRSFIESAFLSCISWSFISTIWSKSEMSYETYDLMECYSYFSDLKKYRPSFRNDGYSHIKMKLHSHISRIN